MSLRRRATALLGLSVAVAGVQSFALPAVQAVSTTVVINEVYVNGGSSGATYSNKYVELFNRTDSPIALSGMSLQYRAPTSAGNSTGNVALSGTIPANGYFTVTGSTNGANGGVVPGADQTSTLNPGAGGGTISLVMGITAVDPSSSSAVVDKIGYGTSNTPEGSGAAPTGNSVTTVLARAASSTDTDANSADFTAQSPTPDAVNTAIDPEPEPEPTGPVPIAEIQGPGATSPLLGRGVTTTGVVTAAYPSGGLFGFYLQTGGTGGPSDTATRTTSEGIFVRQTVAAGAVTVQPGQAVQVQGTVSEFAGQTQVEVTAAGDITAATGTVAPVTATTTTTWPGTGAQKEALEGMRYAPRGDFTVTNNFAANTFGELGLATGTTPLSTPTDVARPGAPAAAVAAANAARAITLDDASSTNFGQRSSGRLVNGGQTPPYISDTTPIRVGAAATFTQDVILTQGGSPSAPTYRFQPLQQVVGNAAGGAGPATFTNTREAVPSAPALEAGGVPTVKVAAFNVLNYFTTLGDPDNDNVGNGGCQADFPDRDGDGNTVSDGCDLRGAWDPQDLARQQAKIVAAINGLDADIVGLMEIENSARLGETPDEATATLVAALNAAAGAGTWAVNPSSTDLEDPAGQDVISNAVIYKPGSVVRTGPARALGNLGDTGEAFVNAREPLAQAFTPVGGGEPVLVVVNHFKSKGSPGPFPGDTDQGDGQGNAAESRRRQAAALRDWVPTVQADLGVEDVLLIGDFNSYTQEDPLQILYDAGYRDVVTEAGLDDTSYTFGGEVGSLDHVLANESALQGFTGADIWDINADEPIALEYSRFNYSATDFSSDAQWRSADHDPVIVGLDQSTDSDVELNLLGFNDLHGRIDANTTKWATTIEQLRIAGGEDNTLLLGSGDSIGASLFASASADDNPTLDVLNAVDVDSSAVGNHEFDKGFEDLRGRVQDRADFSYLGANVYRAGTQTPVLDEYDLFEVDGLSVAVVGAVTQATPTVVSPAGIAGLEFGDPVAAVNRVAGRLSDGIETRNNDEADVIVALYHEGAPAGDTSAPAATLQSNLDSSAVFRQIATETAPEVDAIFTGHSHQKYAYSVPVVGGDLATRPIVQAGQYGEFIGQINLTVDRESGEVVASTQRNVARVAAEDLTLPRVAEVKRITDAALAAAAVVGNQPVASITADITTAFTGGTFVAGKYTGGTRGNRAAESTIGNLVATAYDDGLPSDLGDADLGIVNPGGLRDELYFAGNTTSNPANTDGVVTFAEANAVLPFANNIVLVELTGAQLKAVLEQQWSTTGAGAETGTYLQLGLSENVNVTADGSKPLGSRITSVTIDGAPLDPAQSYSVSTVSFLATGGDNFRAFGQGTARDTGLLDRDLWIGYLDDNSPISPDFDRQQVFESGKPASLTPGVESRFTLGVDQTAPVLPTTGETLDLNSLGSPANTEVVASIDGVTIGTFAVTNGSAAISVTVPTSYTQPGVVTLTAMPSGTTTVVPFASAATPPTPPVVPPVPATIGTSTKADVKPNRVVVDRTRARLTIKVRGDDGSRVTGEVTVKLEGEDKRTVRVRNGKATINLGRFDEVGRIEGMVRFRAADGYGASRDKFNVYVKRR